MVKSLPTMRETGVQSLGQEDPLEKEMATHSSVLAWKIPWTEEPGRLQSMGLQRVRHDWGTSLHFTSLLSEPAGQKNNNNDKKKQRYKEGLQLRNSFKGFWMEYSIWIFRKLWSLSGIKTWTLAPHLKPPRILYAVASQLCYRHRQPLN